MKLGFIHSVSHTTVFPRCFLDDKHCVMLDVQDTKSGSFSHGDYILGREMGPKANECINQ